jgi:hypothetical protein
MAAAASRAASEAALLTKVDSSRRSVILKYASAPRANNYARLSGSIGHTAVTMPDGHTIISIPDYNSVNIQLSISERWVFRTFERRTKFSMVDTPYVSPTILMNKIF